MEEIEKGEAQLAVAWKGLNERKAEYETEAAQIAERKNWLAVLQASFDYGMLSEEEAAEVQVQMERCSR